MTHLTSCVVCILHEEQKFIPFEPTLFLLFVRFLLFFSFVSLDSNDNGTPLVDAIAGNQSFLSCQKEPSIATGFRNAVVDRFHFACPLSNDFSYENVRRFCSVGFVKSEICLRFFCSCRHCLTTASISRKEE